MTIGEAITALGATTTAGETVCVVRFTNGKPLHYTLEECAAKPVSGELYLATGTYAPGAISRHGGRSEPNVRRILWLPFDFDLADYLGLPEGKDADGNDLRRLAVVNDLYPLPQSVIDDSIAALRADVEEVFSLIGLPIHRLDYTGYGLAAYVYLPPHQPEAVPQLRALHKRIVGRINALWRGTLADPQVSDAGTRIMRLVPCVNAKGPIPRQTATLFRAEGVVDEATLTAAAGDTSMPAGRVVPKQGNELADADADAIIAAVSPHWTLGQKHHAALALAGMLAKAGVPEEQAAAIVDRLAASDQTPKDRQKAVRDSYERIRSGLACQGFRTLAELLPAEALAFVDRTLEKVRQATGPIITMGGVPVDVAVAPNGRHDPATPALAANPPRDVFFGWHGNYLALVEPTTEAPDAFHLGASLTLQGAMIGRRVRTKYASDDLYGNLYTVLIGPSGSSRKDTAIKRSLALPQLQKGSTVYVRPAFTVSRDVSSSQGIVLMLKEQPNTLLYLTELSAMIGNARRKSTTTILDRLIEAWDTPHRLENLNKLSPATAESPYLSIVAATQPGRLATEMTDEDIHSGFANRWLYVAGEGKAARPTPPPLDEPDAWRLYLELKRRIDEYPEGTVLPVSPDVEAIWNDWYVTRHARSGQNEELDAMRVRHPALTMKVALLYAVCERATTITLRHVEPAMHLIEWMWEHVQRLLKEWGVGRDAQIERRILAVLEHRGAMKRWKLQAACANRKWTSRDFAGMFESMAKNGTIVIDAAGMVAIGRDD